MEQIKLAPGVHVYKNVFTPDLNLINRLENSLRNPEGKYKWNVARVGEFETNLDHRDCFDFIYNPESLGEPSDDNAELIKIHQDVDKKIRECILDYSRQYDLSIEYIEAFNFVKYGKNQKFMYHSDDGDPYRCTLSLVGYINDDYTGGELDFKFFDMKIKPEAGDLVLFPSSYIYSHASVPVETGTKYAIVVMTDRNKEAHISDSKIYKINN